MADNAKTFFALGVNGMLPIVFVSGPVPAAFSISNLTDSKSIPTDCNAFIATPCPKAISPNKICSVPTYP